MKKTVITLMMSLVATLVMAQENNTHVNDSVTWSKDLDGVIVTRMRRNVKADVDKISYDVKNDADAKASTVLDFKNRITHFHTAVIFCLMCLSITVPITYSLCVLLYCHFSFLSLIRFSIR